MSALGFVPPMEKAHAAGICTISDAGGNWNNPATWVEGSIPTASDDVVATATSGNFTINATAVAKSVNLTNYSPGRILTHNSGIGLTISGNLVFPAGITYTLGNATTSAIIFNDSANITTAGKTLGNITFNKAGGTFQLQDALTSSGSLTLTAGTFVPNNQLVTLNGATPTITGSFTFYDLTRAGNAVKTNSLILTANETVTHTLALTGESFVNRLLVTSNTLGSPRIITATIVSISNTDFREITGAGEAIWSGTSIGDCGGNSNITAAPAVPKYWVGNGGSWADPGPVYHWATESNGAPAAGNIPLPQDDVYFDLHSFTSNSQAISTEMPRLGKSINWTGATNNPTWNLKTSNNTLYGSLELIPLMSSVFWYTLIFEGRGDFSLTKSGRTLGSVTVQMVNGTLTLQDDLLLPSSGGLVLNNGTLTAVNVNVSFQYFSATGTSVVNMGSGTWSSLSYSYADWGVETGVTVNAQTSTIALTYAGASTPRFNGGSKVYNNLTITGGGAGAVIFSGSNTFNNFTIGAPKTVTFVNNSTQTIIGNFIAVGTAGNIITINSDLAGYVAKLSKSSGIVMADYLSLQDSIAMGGSLWLAGSHSTNVSGNSGWKFGSPKVISNAGGNWSDAGAWVGATIPTANDDIFATSTSGNLTIDSNASCRSIDLTNYTGTLTHDSNVILSVGNGDGGSLKFVSGMAYTPGSNITSVINFISTATSNTISWGGKSVGSTIFNGVGGEWRFQDATTINGNFQMDAGKLTTSCESFLVAGSQIINGGTLVNSQSESGYFKLSINPVAHNDYGAVYPLTYEFEISPGSANLNVYKKYTNLQPWSQIPEKTASDFFNGIETVRFDYPTNKAYISVAFSDVSDDIYLRITNISGNPVCMNYLDIPDYYDNRNAAVTVTGDDWGRPQNDSADQASAAALRSRSIWSSIGIITTGGPPNWAMIQDEINAGFVEPASHSRTHHTLPYTDYDSDIGGSRDDIINNLDLPALNKKGVSEYVYAWIEPYGTSNATVRTKLGQYKYLADRSTSNSLTNEFTSWDGSNNVFNYTGTSYFYDTGNLTAANSKFDTVIGAGDIYHLWGHPYNTAWTPGSWLLDHLDYIKEKTNLWYAGFGHLYLYRYLDSQNKISDEKIAFSSALASATATTLGSYSIKIDWVSGGTQNKFNVYRGGESGVGTLIHSANDLIYTDIDLDPYTTYTYYIYSVDVEGIENPSFVSVAGVTQGTHGSGDDDEEETTPTETPVSSEILAPEAIVEEITQTLHDYNVSPPSASFSFPDNNIVGNQITFDASGSTSNKGIVSYFWDFGDGETSNDVKTTHEYKFPGRYTVTLTVTDRAGNKNTTTKTIDIKPRAPTITDITAKGTALWIEGKADPSTIIYFTIHSNPFEGQGLANKDGYWTYYLDKASEVLGAGDHTIVAQAAVKLSDNTELTGAESKTYDFKMSVDDGKLKVEMKKTRVWQIVSLGLVLLIVIGFLLKRFRKSKLINR